MVNRKNLMLLACLAALLILISACTSVPGTDTTESLEIDNIAEFPTATSSATALPSATATLTPTPTPTATPTLVPTVTPTPTATPVPPEFNNLVLALDYDRASFTPLSPRDYFPFGVTYIAVIFDYSVPNTTRLDWYIHGAEGQVEASGMISLNSRNSQKAFIVRPQMGLDEGQYELSLELDGEIMLSRQFEVFWNPTLWPITVGTNFSANMEIIGVDDRFPLGSEFLFASYPTINFTVGDELVAEWFVDGLKLGEHRFVWNNPDWSTGIHANVIDNQVDDAAPLPAGNYEIIIYVNDVPQQCKAFQVTDSPTRNEAQGCEAIESIQAISPNSWGRYQSRTFSELDLLTGELLSHITGDKTIYLETSPDYQYPSRVRAVFTGDFRDTSEFRLEWIKAWMATFAPNLSETEIISLFAQEGLFMEDNKEYWLPIQNPLIAIMEDELSVGDEVELLVIWMGATIDSGEIDRIYLVNAFQDMP
jgi:hypothetical protein